MRKRRKWVFPADEDGFEFDWWAIPCGVLLGLALALGALWFERQGIWPEWLGFRHGGGFFDKRTGDTIPLLGE